MNTSTHRIRRGLALATVVTALAAPAASAAPVDPQGVNEGYRSAYSPTQPTEQPAPALSDGFDWGDAGIGATAMLAFAAIVAGTTVAIGHRPRRHTVA